VGIVLEISFRHWTPPAGAIIGQLQRAALSVQLNIAEGYARRSRRVLLNHLDIAYGSAMETAELLDLLQDHCLAPEALLTQAIDANAEVRSLILGLKRHFTHH
jgi:four helix bundle protein